MKPANTLSGLPGRIEARGGRVWVVVEDLPYMRSEKAFSTVEDAENWMADNGVKPTNGE